MSEAPMAMNMGGLLGAPPESAAEIAALKDRVGLQVPTSWDLPAMQDAAAQNSQKLGDAFQSLQPEAKRPPAEEVEDDEETKRLKAVKENGGKPPWHSHSADARKFEKGFKAWLAANKAVEED